MSAVAAPIGTRFALLTVRRECECRTAHDARAVRRAELEVAPAAGARLDLGGRVVWSPDARSLIVARPVLRDWLLITVGTRVARRLAPPRDLPPDNGFPLPTAWR